MATTIKMMDDVSVNSVLFKKPKITVVSLLSEDEEEDEKTVTVNSVSSPIIASLPNVADVIVIDDDADDDDVTTLTTTSIATDDHQAASATIPSSSLTPAELDYIDWLKSMDKDFNFGFSSQDLLDLGDEIIVQRPSRRQQKEDDETKKYMNSPHKSDPWTTLSTTSVSSTESGMSKIGDESNLIDQAPNLAIAVSPSPILANNAEEEENQVDKFAQIVSAAQSQSSPSPNTSLPLSGNTLIVDVSDDEFDWDRQPLPLDPASSSSSASSLYGRRKLSQLVSPQRKKHCTPSHSPSTYSLSSVSSVLSSISSTPSFEQQISQNKNPIACQVTQTSNELSTSTTKSNNNGILKHKVSTRKTGEQSASGVQLASFDKNFLNHEQKNLRQQQANNYDDPEKEKRGQNLSSFKKDHLTVYSRTLRLSNLADDVRRQDISDLFPVHEHIHSISILGFTFLVMTRREDAVKALQLSQHVKLKGRRLQLQWSPGGRMSGRKWKDFWKVDEGVFYIPWSKLSSDTNLKTFEDGGTLDVATLPPFLRRDERRSSMSDSGGSNRNKSMQLHQHRRRQISVERNRRKSRP